MSRSECLTLAVSPSCSDSPGTWHVCGCLCHPPHTLSSHPLTSTVWSEGAGSAHPQLGETEALAGGRPPHYPQESNSEVGKWVAPGLCRCPCALRVSHPWGVWRLARVTGIRLGVCFTNTFLPCPANGLQDLQTREIALSLKGPQTGKLEATHQNFTKSKPWVGGQPNSSMQILLRYFSCPCLWN